MDDAPTPPAPPPDPEPEPEPGTEPDSRAGAESPAAPVPAGRRRPMAVALAVVLVAAAVGVAGWQLNRPSGADFPSAWDPRVVSLVDFVEDERGLDFDHPVHVDFLPDAEFRAAVTADESELTADERSEIAHNAGVLRALGLVEGDVDLFEAVNRLSGEGILAYYDTETKRIRVRGTELTVKVRGTLVHELTHALQDQVFDLGREGEFPIDGQNDTYRPVFEGDASRVEGAWVENLGDDDLEDYFAAESADVAGVDLSGVPEALRIFFTAPYDFGEPFVQVVLADGGQRAVDRALEEPPPADVQLLDPFRYLAGEDPRPVDEPALEAGEERGDGGAFGALSLFMTLAARIDAHQALRAADAWAGDAYVSYERDGRPCVRATFAAADVGGAAVVGDALDAWAVAMPPGAASVSRTGTSVGLRSCDPGAGEAPTTAEGTLSTALTVPLMRTYIALGGLVASGDPELSRCVGGRFVAQFGAGELAEMLVAAGPTPAFLAAAERAGEECRT